MKAEELISKYFLDQLSPEEKVYFERLMATDKEFREQVEFENVLRKSIFQSEHFDLKRDLQGIEKSLGKPQTSTKWYLAAASIVIFIAIGFFWNSNRDTPERLFSEYYKVASNTSNPIVRTNNEVNETTRAFLAYENADYRRAQKLFEKVYSSSNNSELLFYEAMCYLEIGENQLAIDTFTEHISLDDRLKGKSKWYLALAFLKVDMKDKAVWILEDIISNKSNYNFDKAKKLRGRL